MTLLIDTSYLYALYNVDDPDHGEALRFAQRYKGKTTVPIVVIPEVTFLFERDTGYRSVVKFMKAFTSTATPLEPVLMEDLQRAAEIMAKYQSAKLDLVDGCIMALSERMNITQVLTFDRRDFSMFRPKHCDYLELLP